MHGWLACLVYKSLKSVCVCVPAHVCIHVLIGVGVRGKICDVLNDF